MVLNQWLLPWKVKVMFMLLAPAGMVIGYRRYNTCDQTGIRDIQVD
jgi:hypothetical protein